MRSRRIPRYSISLMFHVYKDILPEVEDQIKNWKIMAHMIPHAPYRNEAIHSIETKKFHCQGGAIYALMNKEQKHVLIPLIVAFQLISDYLDNLCDRASINCSEDFRALHQALLDAIEPGKASHAYYVHREEQEDNGYLAQLVKCCQQQISLLPSYSQAYPLIERYVKFYIDLQVYKHLNESQRESELMNWWEKNRSLAPHLAWFEFAAATGSTLGVFHLFALASEAHVCQADMEQQGWGYFPHVCALHILLDYLIDQQEDEQSNELNFCSYYENEDKLLRRIFWIAKQAHKDVSVLHHSYFHQMVIEGMIALYLSDPKVSAQQGVLRLAKELIKKGSNLRVFFWINSYFIRKHQKKKA